VQTELSLKKAVQMDRDTLIIRELLVQDPEIVSAEVNHDRRDQ
jgi:hypothetical protein